MKKYIVISIIAVVALLPFAAWADTGGSAVATLTFDSVINTKVTDNWDGLTITQKDLSDSISSIAGAGGTFPIDWDTTTPNITVKVQAMTKFAVYSSYSTSPAKNGGGATDFTTPDSVIYLSENGGGFADYIVYSLISSPETYAGDGTGLTDISFSGTNNVGAGGATKTYDVKWNPSNVGDQGVGGIDFTIYFVVTDSST